MFKKMLSFAVVAGMVFALATAATAATIVDTTYSVDTNLPGVGDFFLENASATWTINPGVTVTAGNGSSTQGRFFVETDKGADGDSTFTVNGGGTLIQDATGEFAFRLGHLETAITGTLIIEGGSTFRSTAGGAFRVTRDGGGFLTLKGVGSTFSAKGSYDAGGGLFLASGLASPSDVPVSYSGGALAVTDLGGAFTQLSVSSAPPEGKIALVNANFNSGTFNPSEEHPPGWTLVNGSGSQDNYAQTLSGLASPTLAMKSGGGNYVEQGFNSSDEGAVDASTYGQYTLDLDYGYRRDGATNGDIDLRFALWNTTDGTELAFATLTIPDPGVGGNFLTAGSVDLLYDNTVAGLVGDAIALRITNTMNFGGDSWKGTAVVDNLVLTGVPEPSCLAVLALGSIGILMRRRRQRR